MFLQERVTSHNENMQYVNLSVKACQKSLHRSDQTQDRKCTCTVKRDCRGQVKKSSDSIGDSFPVSVPFGPHLIPVRCQQVFSPETRNTTTNNPEVSADATQRTKPACAVRAHQDGSLCLTQSGPCDPADGTSEKEPRTRTITTNDLLDCLVHPDVITRVTELLLERQTGSSRNLRLVTKQKPEPK